MISRIITSALVLAASTIVGIASYEGYRDEAYQPLPDDVYTIGFGTTSGVHPGQITTPVRSLQILLHEIEGKYAVAVRKCITVPLTQYEFAAYVSLAYNIGTTAFCKSTLARKVNSLKYAEGCKQILRWDFSKGRRIKGLTRRRQSEFRTCMGAG